MNRKYGVFLGERLANRFLTRLGAQCLVVAFAEKGLAAKIHEVCECGQIQNSVYTHENGGE